MKVYKHRLLICAVLMLLPALGNAADLTILDEIIVRGSSVPSNEENLTIREVRESPARDIGEAVQNIPGVTILRKGSIANDIVLRGLQRDNINVLIGRGARPWLLPVAYGPTSLPLRLCRDRSDRDRQGAL